MKRWGAWTLAVVALFGVFVSYYGIYILLAYFASGLVGWASVALLVSGLHDARNYHIRHPHDDAPGMVVASVIYVGAPFLFIASLPPTIAGVVIASRKKRLH